MQLTEALFHEASLEATGQLVVSYNGNDIDLGSPFARRPMANLVADETGIPLAELEDGMARDGSARVTAASAAAGGGLGEHVGVEVREGFQEVKKKAVAVVECRGCAPLDVGKVAEAGSYGVLVNELFEVGRGAGAVGTCVCIGYSAAGRTLRIRWPILLLVRGGGSGFFLSRSRLSEHTSNKMLRT